MLAFLALAKLLEANSPEAYGYPYLLTLSGWQMVRVLLAANSSRWRLCNVTYSALLERRLHVVKLFLGAYCSSLKRLLQISSLDHTILLHQLQGLHCNSIFLF